ncbi:hypothetical protein DPMN_025425 [Dreissena polymorpha]|uniref:Phosphatidylinositol N-acetylglucosaminyltransferase subunit Q n=2 Tax=Dreissena polymorpha TaxID=45954 RepID=A0A9D4LRI5_DREPO|nr:hypothetical protein DPMN_025425 [Dreissena polymorpha]
MLGNLIDPPTFVTQLRLRSNKFTSVRTNRYENTVNSKETSNLCVGQVLDTMLGLACMWILMSNGTAQWLANIGLAYGDKTAEGLKELLDWLMGAPAGLKLNSQLTHFLGKFFQYHIYLWTVYLSIIRPVLGSLLFYSSLSGVLGLTFQLALLQDILATMTVHIYCFYVYAARLYRLQIYALGSLWRLFRGKKWNVLRQRVDSAVYDVDQLFVGTLLFTVLLFILPTSALYYVVFTLLRILVLVIQGLLTRMRSILDTTPWWSVLRWLFNRQCLVDGAYLTTHTSSKSNNLVLYMHGTSPSLSTVLSSCREPTSGSPYTWATILKNLIHGHLIYPWIEMKQS